MKEQNSATGLSRIQKKWLPFCIVEILMMNAINWTSFERAGFGGYKKAAFSWMFCHGKIFWEYLLMPAFTVGSLRRKTQIEGLLEFVQFLLQQDNAGKKIEELGKKLDSRAKRKNCFTRRNRKGLRSHLIMAYKPDELFNNPTG